MVRPLVAALAVALLAACGDQSSEPTVERPARPAKAAPAVEPYTPSAHHPRRPRGAIYHDEVGENVVGTRYRRIVEVFGPPLVRRAPCAYYRLVGQRGSFWRFCFVRGVMDGAAITTDDPRYSSRSSRATASGSSSCG